MSWYLTVDEATHEEARADFSWDLPSDYNAAYDFVRKHDDPTARVALFQAYPDGRRETYTFHELDVLSNRLAHGLRERGVDRGDRVATVVPQKPENPLTALACWKLGAVVLPLSVLFGPDALRYRLRNSGTSVVVVDDSVSETVEAVAGDCPELEHVVVVDGGIGVDDADAAETPVTTFEAVCADQPRDFEIVDTGPETPGVVLYTSGSTGPPKGVLHSQALWAGHCPAFYMYFERDVLEKSVCWTPADWAWIGSLGDLLYPAWHYGRPVVGYPMGKFSSETAYELVEEFGVTDAFLPPTAIRMMMEVDAPSDRYDLALDAVCSGGEPLTPEILTWADEELEGVAVNELYGQTEANLLVTNCREWFDARPGSMGKPVPGHDVTVVDDDGDECPPGEVGDIAVRRAGDPVVFREYLGEPEKTAATRRGPWHLTGDLGSRDEDGYLWFKSRADDVIITSGYRVGPGEVESAILEHEAVEQVGVVGVPDDTRGEIIKAFVQPTPGVDPDDDLRAEIQDLVRDTLAKYEYPRAVEFVSELPQTTTGKIQRSELKAREVDEV